MFWRQLFLHMVRKSILNEIIIFQNIFRINFIHNLQETALLEDNTEKDHVLPGDWR